MIERPTLHVLAGTNGSGKSSVAGAFLRAKGGQYFNPDEVTRTIRDEDPALDPDTANSLAWHLNVKALRKAIAQSTSYTFETTLGGKTIPALLREAALAGLVLRIWFIGLDSPERHLARIAERVKQGGHDIPPDKVRERYRTSLRNLIALMPLVTDLRLYDNSAENDPVVARPVPQLILDVTERTIRFPARLTQLEATPAWAKPAVVRAFDTFPSPLTGRP